MNNNIDLTEYINKLYSVAVKKAGDSFVAEEITQDTFLSALQALHRGKAPDNVWAWLVRILSCKYCDYLRQKYNKPQISFEDYQFEIADESDHFSDDEFSEKLETIRRELGFLAKTHREVMVRFYMHGHSIEKIASDLSIPIGTVKSRLNTGRQHIREGVKVMENYTKQSYEPDILYITCSGGIGINDEPFSLVPDYDRLSQNVLLLAYEKPVKENELAKMLGVPAGYIEPVVERMINGELMKRTDGGKVYTDFIIYNENDRKATFDKQLETAEKYFELFWRETQNGLEALREKSFYKRQDEHAKKKLEIHFCINTLTGGCGGVSSEVTRDPIHQTDNLYRRDGGTWCAMGNKYTHSQSLTNNTHRNYSISGENGIEIKNFCGAKEIQMRQYYTELGSYPNCYFKKEYIEWIYELYKGISPEKSAVGGHVIEAAERLLKDGVLKKAAGLLLDLPVLSNTEYRELKMLSSEYQVKVSADIYDVMIKLFDNGYVCLPKHLISIPKWQQYMFCSSSVAMAVIYQAIEKGLFMQGIDYPLPATILVVDE